MNQKHLTKHISCDCRCEFDGKKCNLRQKWNRNKCQCECKKPINILHAKRIMFGIPADVLASMIRFVKLANS